MLLLAELKLISCCVTWYKRDPIPQEKAVDARATVLPGEYPGNARNLDTKFGGVHAGEEGPVARRLASYPRLQGSKAGCLEPGTRCPRTSITWFQP